METLTFNSFTKKIYVQSDLATVYQCWATESGISSWFLSRARYTDAAGRKRAAGEPIQAGDRYSWEWHNYDGGETGSILEANGRDHLQFSFAGPCKVSVDLEEDKAHTLVSLRQYDIPEDEASRLNIHFGCSNGWTFWLTNLKAYLEHGIVLNETEKDLRQVPLAGHIFVNI